MPDFPRNDNNACRVHTHIMMAVVLSVATLQAGSHIKAGLVKYSANLVFFSLARSTATDSGNKCITRNITAQSSSSAVWI